MRRRAIAGVGADVGGPDADAATGTDADAGADSDADADAEFQAYMLARWPVLVRTAFLLTGDRFLAEDLAQTALTRVYASWRRVRRVDDVDAYVRRVLVNANSARFRKRRVAEQLVGVAADGRSHVPHEPIAQRSALMAALAELPPRQRAVVVLRYWEDLPEREVAAVLGCSVGTVKSQASKALARLRTSSVLLDRDPMVSEPGKKEPE
ncbi:SigE family RNA polymerase sigma factor [Catenulispora pinisilvae]|uniref:SigE family RNA polymerase sigma factor n=2 Tax=Catenulispora pinisilvae TaxID=2705253 RepID=UPI0018928473|nr:SigE family RNA polymerase sigma factor [Catenulispora pinisilvae]